MNLIKCFLPASALAASLFSLSASASEGDIARCVSSRAGEMSLGALGGGVYSFVIAGEKNQSTITDIQTSVHGAQTEYIVNTVSGLEMIILVENNRLISMTHSAYGGSCDSISTIDVAKLEALYHLVESRPVYAFLRCSLADPGQSTLAIDAREGLVPGTMVLFGEDTGGRGGETFRSLVRSVQSSVNGSVRTWKLEGTASYDFSAAGRHTRQISGLVLKSAPDADRVENLSFEVEGSGTQNYRCAVSRNLELVVGKLAPLSN